MTTDMHLEPKETILIENGFLGFRNRLTLTNKRLIFEEGSGYFLTVWKQYHHVLLDAIEEAFVDRDAFFVDTVNLKLKDGPVMKIRFQIDAKSNGVYESTPERLVTAINQHLKA